jgi:hypothetical protein
MPKTPKPKPKKIIKRSPTGQFLPGTIGNPDGRPRIKDSIPDLLRELGDYIDPEAIDPVSGTNKTRRMRLCEILYDASLGIITLTSAQLQAIMYLMNREVGSPRQSVSLTGGLSSTISRVDLSPEAEQRIATNIKGFFKETE